MSKEKSITFKQRGKVDHEQMYSGKHEMKKKWIIKTSVAIVASI